MSSCGCSNSTSLPIGLTGATGTPGTNGTDGTDGIDGVSVLYAGNVSGGIVTAVATSGVGFTTLQTHTLAAANTNTNANELAVIGDTIEINASLYVTSTAVGDGEIDLWMGGATLIPVPPTLIKMVAGVKNCNIRAIITFQTSTTVSVQFEVNMSALDGTSLAGYNFYSLNATVANMLTTTNAILLKGKNASGAGNLISYNFLVTKYKAI